MPPPPPPNATSDSPRYLFRYLLLANILLYLEAGAVPALLVTLAEQFGMDQAQQGFMGGIVYLMLCVGAPVAGILLKSHSPKTIIGLSLILNNLAMLGFALTPPAYPHLLILARAAVGFTQVTVCIYSPLWTDTHAPPEARASYMASLQAAVPIGVMAGYIIAMASLYVCDNFKLGIAAWRVPFLIQVVLVTPLCGGIWAVPTKHIVIESGRARRSSSTANPGGIIGASPTENILDLASQSRKGVHVVQGLFKKKAGVDNGNNNKDLQKERVTLLGALRKGAVSPVRDDSFSSFPSLPRQNSYTPHEIKLLKVRNEISTLYSPYKSKAFVERVLGEETNCELEGGGEEADEEEEDGDDEESLGDEPTEKTRLCATPTTDYENQFGTVAPTLPPTLAKDVLLARIDSNYGEIASDTDNDLDARLFGRDKPSVLRMMATYVNVLVKIPVYIFLVFALAACYFVVTGVQFWGTAYLTTVLHAPQAKANLLFIITSATGPTTGVFFGGWLIDQNGGYKGFKNRNKTMRTCAYLGGLSCLFGFPSTVVTNVYLFAVLLWLMLFFGGAVLPGCTGVAVSVVPRQLRPVSLSVSLIVFNLFGYSLSLILSGAMMQVFNDTLPDCDYACSLKIGFRLIVFWGLWSLLLLIAAIVSSHRSRLHSKRGSLKQSIHNLKNLEV